MRFDLEGLNGNGNPINYSSEEVNDVVFTRPSSLPLKKRIIFSPTLPPTPEAYPFRERSYCSLPRKMFSDSSLDGVATSKPPYTKSQSPKKDKKTVPNTSLCCSWLTLRWHKYLRKSSSRRDVKHDVIERVTSLPVLNRRRAATISTQPASLKKKVCIKH